MEALGLISIPLFSLVPEQPLPPRTIWFSREPLEDPLSYQVLEAQPDVLEATRAAGRAAKTVRRQILLTPFGQDFCRVCLRA